MWTRLTLHPAFISLLLATATLVVFLPTVRHDFLTYDDPDYVTTNPHVQGGFTRDAMVWAFRTGHSGNWHPLTWLSHMLDCQLYGLEPAGHHLTSLLFHALNTMLLYILLRRLTGAVWRSAFVAALFALHPLHVESVAWVSERKDVLSACFFMLTLWAYARYVEVQSLKSKVQSPGTRNTQHATRFYLLSLSFFALGLMSKPMLVTLPCVLLLLDYWPLRRFELKTLDFRLKTLVPLLREKWPFFLLSAGSCVATVLAQSRAMQPLANLSLSSRLANCLIAYARYLGKTLWPVNLATPYPYPAHWPLANVLLAGALLAGLTLAVLYLSRRWPVAVTGWFWFLGMLVPAIGLVQVGEQSMADRYTYLPSIGLFILLAWGAGAAFTRWRVPKIVCGIAAGLVLLACAGRTREQLAYWQNSDALFRHAVSVTKDNWLAWFNLGLVLDNQGHVDEALADYRKAVALQPNYVEALLNIGATLANRKQFSDAIPFFERALRQNPDSVDGHDNLGHALMEVGKPDAAIPHLRQVLQHRPNDVDSLNSLADALTQAGQFAAAIPHLEASLLAKPDQPVAHYSLAMALVRLGRTDQAIEHFRDTIRLQPNVPAALNGLAWIRAANSNAAFRNGEEAVQLARRACELTGYRRPALLFTLAAAYAEAGRFEEAITTAQKARDLALASGQKELAAKSQQMLQLYQNRQPYHELPAAARAAP
jgi:tetratricopeptide (TPR) repeat protein